MWQPESDARLTDANHIAHAAGTAGSASTAYAARPSGSAGAEQQAKRPATASQAVPVPPDWIAGLPKVELHCHLDGIVDPPMLRELSRRGYRLPLTADALESGYPVRSMDDFMRWGMLAHPLEGDIERFKPVLMVHLERLRTQGVVYTEIMIAGGEIPQDTAEALEVLAGFREWATSLHEGSPESDEPPARPAQPGHQERPGAPAPLEQRGHHHQPGAPALLRRGGRRSTIQVAFLACLNRRRPPEQIKRRVQTIVRLVEAGLLCGFAMAGPEIDNPLAPHARTFDLLRDAGVPVTVHAGEWCGPESVWDAIRSAHPRRIGHGVAAFDDPALLERIQEQQIHLEMCPTSNVCFGSLCRDIEQHPIRRARDLGLSFSVNTDDPGASRCSMASEYALLAERFGFTSADFERMYRNSMAARFQSRLVNPA